MAKRTITLSGRPPISIDEANWPVVAKADEKTWDNTYEFQANQTWKWFVRVRQHADGRAIVYAGYDDTSNSQGSQDTHDRQGDYLAVIGTTCEHVCNSIINVCARMAGDSDTWARLANECIADLPAEDVDGNPSSRSPLVSLMIEVEQLRRDNDRMRAALAAATPDCPHNWLSGYCDLCGAVKPASS